MQHARAVDSYIAVRSGESQLEAANVIVEIKIWQDGGIIDCVAIMLFLTHSLADVTMSIAAG